MQGWQQNHCYCSVFQLLIQSLKPKWERGKQLRSRQSHSCTRWAALDDMAERDIHQCGHNDKILSLKLVFACANPGEPEQADGQPAQHSATLCSLYHPEWGQESRFCRLTQLRCFEELSIQPRNTCMQTSNSVCRRSVVLILHKSIVGYYVLQVWLTPSWSCTSWGVTEFWRASGSAGRDSQIESCMLSSSSGGFPTAAASWRDTTDVVARSTHNFTFSVTAFWIPTPSPRIRLWIAGKPWRSCWAHLTSTTHSTSLDTRR